MGKYAIYNNNDYPLNIRGNKLRLKSTKKENGFQELVDLAGNKHNDIFIKEVDEEDVENAYELQVNAIYQGKEFQTRGVGNHCITENEINLFSMEKEDVEDYGFEKEEQFVFKKDVKLDDIDALVEIKKPILKFKGEPISRKVIPKNSIKEYIKKFD